MKYKTWVAGISATLALVFSNGNAQTNEIINYKTNEVNCMTNALYFEARNQPENGIRAVAHVIKNRAENNNKSICYTVHEKINGICQFSYFCEHKKVNDYTTYDKIQHIASEVVYNNEYDFTNGSEYYHTVSSRYRWDKKMIKTITIANHVFYKENNA